MTTTLPEGTSLGMMEAPLSWVYSHTARFLGKVRIFVQEGEGFMLIRRGEALAYCFRHGSITLRGNAAKEYLLSQDAVKFSLCKYTEEEFDRAAAWCRDHGVPVHDQGRAVHLSPANINGGFITGNQPFVGVDRGGHDSRKRTGMVQNAADIVIGQGGQLDGVILIIEKVVAIEVED